MNKDNKNFNLKKPISLFLGTKGENNLIFKELVDISINKSLEARKERNENEPCIVTDEHINSDLFEDDCKLMKRNTEIICNYLKGSVMASSLKYNSNMLPDPNILSFVGTISGLIYNQNNIIPHASNKTSLLEKAIGIEICKMIGYDMTQYINYYNLKNQEIDYIKMEHDSIYPFSHQSSNGSISNIEACWSSMWVKFIPVALKNSILNEPKLESIKNLEINLVNGSKKKIINCTNWELLNLNCDESVNLPYMVCLSTGLSKQIVDNLINKYHPINIGIHSFLSINKINCPVFVISATSHYSFSKASSLIGIGLNNIISINVETNGRMDINDLEIKLFQCYNNEIPVINVVSVIGTTQESSFDDIESILSLRNKFRNKLFNFDIHIDGAIGGYYLSCIREHSPIENPVDQILFGNEEKEFANEFNVGCPIESFEPSLILGEYVIKQLNNCKYSDTMTLDSHKSGFTLMTNGITCFRNSKFKDMLAMVPIYLGGAKNYNLVGLYGIDGSRPGHPSISTYLTHSILRPTKFGYGRILKRCILNSKLFFIKLLTLFNDNEPFNVIPIAVGNQISTETLNYLKSRLIDSNGDIINLKYISLDLELLKLLSTIGPDLNVLCFCFNFKNNKDYLKFIELNQKLIKTFGNNQGEESEYIVANSTFTNKYGNKFINHYLNLIGISSNLPFDSIDIKIPTLRKSILHPFIGETDNGNYYNTIFNVLKKELNKFY